jgi:SAM-dependent methyltransferase
LPTPGHWIGEHVFRRVGDDIGLVECRDCGLVFGNPRPCNDLLNEFYSGENYSCHAPNDHAGTGQKASFLLERIEQKVPRPGRLLDFGAGGGWFLERARERGWDVIGFDVGQKSVLACRARGLHITQQLDTLPPHAFDVILLHHVLEHLTAPIETLIRLRQLLSARGRLFIEVPNARSLRARLSLSALSRYANVDERYRAFPIHLFYFGPRSLSIVLQRAQLCVESLETTGIGLDELIAHQPRPADAYDAPGRLARVIQRAESAPVAWIKTRFKQALHGNLLGESLLATASAGPG